MNHLLNLTTEELICVAYSAEESLQFAIDNNISSRIPFYINLRNKIQLLTNGPVAQRLEQSTHNALVAGSNPAGSTN